MRLRALDGQFFGNANGETRSYRRQGNDIAGAQGVLFQCPKCAAGKPVADDGEGVQGAHYVRVCFANPHGAPVAPPSFDKNPRWQMSGSCIDDLTLTPSVNLDVPENGPDACKWHGFVTNGDAS